MRKALLLLLLLGAAARSHATVAKAVSFDQKVGEADSIVLGRCIGTQSQMDESGRWIVTYSTFDVERSWKGVSHGNLTLITPGGVVDGLHQETVGIPSFSQGDERVLFVKNTAHGPSVLYFEQGTYALQKSASSTVVMPVASGMIYVDAQGNARDRDESPRSLDDFDRLVRASLAKQRQVGNFGMTSAVGLQPAASKQAANLLVDFARHHVVAFSLILLALVAAVVVVIRSM